MKNQEHIRDLSFLFLAVFLFSTKCLYAQEPFPCPSGGKVHYFGVEINNMLCGYSEVTSCSGILDGRNVLVDHSNVVFKMKLLGKGVDSGFETTYVSDPETGRAIRIELTVRNGQSLMKTITRIAGDTVWFSSPALSTDRVLTGMNDVLFSSLTKDPHLYADFIQSGIKQKKYRIFDHIKGEAAEKQYTWKSDEDITLADSLFHTIVLEEYDLATGLRTMLWLNRADGFNVKVQVAGRNIFFADKSVTSRLSMAEMDELFFTRVNKSIPDFMNLTRMKVAARINTYGEKVTPESLNFPGQQFIGTVTDNFIEGVFEITPVRYNGKDAPSFPRNFEDHGSLSKYLGPETMIESDDPGIVALAGSLTAGSKNSWEAAVRLSKWVAEHIAGALPGGVSAVNTLKMREAECGGHSRLLAALCRAAGIPARLSVGCMYINYYGGSFGQHAWTEVYMGDAGWIPIDATIREIDFTDAGHIRLGEAATFRPEKMEIMEYETEKRL